MDSNCSLQYTRIVMNTVTYAWRAYLEFAPNIFVAKRKKKITNLKGNVSKSSFISKLSSYCAYFDLSSPELILRLFLLFVRVSVTLSDDVGISLGIATSKGCVVR